MKWFRRSWLYLLVFTLPFERIPSYDLAVAGHNVTLRASFVLALGILAVAFIHLVRQRRFEFTRADVWLAGYGGVMLLSLGMAVNKGRSLQVIIATGLMIGLAMVIERSVRRIDFARLYHWLMAAALITCAIGLYQFLGDSFGLSPEATGLRDIYTKQVFGFPRIQSVALEPLYFASFLILPIMLLIARIYTRAANWKPYLALWFIVTCLALTLSRGGIYGSLAGAIVVVVLLHKYGSWKRLGLVVAMLAAAAGSALGLVSLTTTPTSSSPTPVKSYVQQSTKLTSNAQSADSDRSLNRKLALKAISEHPLLGVGIGNFGAYAQQNHSRYRNNSSVIVNNEYLEIVAETGLLGLATLLGFVVALLWQIYRVWSKLTPPSRLWVAALVAASCGAAVQFYAFSTLYIIHIWVAIGLLLGLTRRGKL